VGLEANGFATTVGKGPLELFQSGLLDTLGAGDVFVWVGVANFEWKWSSTDKHFWPQDALRNLTAKGVLTVFYSTESYISMPCTEKRMLPVREIWEYTQSNVLCCPDDPSAARVRYVPPGYVPRPVLAGSSSTVATSTKPPRLVFFGSASGWYWLRNKCLSRVTSGLAASWAAEDAPSLRAAQALSHRCLTSGCQSCNSSHCPVITQHGIGNDQAWDRVVATQRYHLNVHKACEWGLAESEPTVSNSSCESFRLAALLSAGAEVFSERCHAADEKEYEGFVRFLPIPEMAAAVMGSWRAAQPSGPGVPSSRERADQFARRFAPAAIFERAGLPAVLAAHREARVSSWTSPLLTRFTRSVTESAEPLRKFFPGLPAFCCMDHTECAKANKRTNKPKRTKAVA